MAPIISSRTPEGEPNWCPICSNLIEIEPSEPTGDAPCPHCGCLVWSDRRPEVARVAPPIRIRRVGPLAGVNQRASSPAIDLMAMERLRASLSDLVAELEAIGRKVESIRVKPRRSVFARFRRLFRSSSGFEKVVVSASGGVRDPWLDGA